MTDPTTHGPDNQQPPMADRDTPADISRRIRVLARALSLVKRLQAKARDQKKPNGKPDISPTGASSR